MPEKDEREEDDVGDPGLVLIGESFTGEGAEALHVKLCSMYFQAR